MARGNRGKGRLAALLVVAASLATNAQAWGPTGHSDVGAIADRMLKTHPQAASQVRSILGNLRLSQAGAWADCIGNVNPPNMGFRYARSARFGAACRPFESVAGIAEMEDYAHRNWTNCSNIASDCHAQYHYVSLAVQRGAYQDGAIGTSDHDVVKAINAAVTVLRGGQPPPPFNFTRREALLLLVHLVGDVHQPLRVGQLYLNESGSREDPESSTIARLRAMFTSTQNGSLLIWGDPQRPSDLLSLWDGITAGDYSFAAAGRVPRTTGPVDSWAAQWTTESLNRSRAAFEGLSFGPNLGSRWEVTFRNESEYQGTRRQVQRRQIERAGARLAQLLVAIWPDA